MATSVNRTRPTVAMVAQAAGVSRAAVYAALNRNNSSNIGLSPETRGKIEAAIHKLGYIPNNNARSLVSGRSRNIGLLLTFLSAPFDNNLADAFKRVFARDNYQIIVDYHNNDPEAEREKLRNFFAQGVDALIIAQTSPAACRDILAKFLAGGIRVICIGAEVVYPDYCYIAFDEPRVMRLIAGHLREAAVRRVAYVAGNNPDWGSRIRQAHLETALKENGMPPLAASEHIDGYGDLRRLAARWSAAGDAAPEAVVCFNDRLANAMIHALNQAQVDVPRQVRVIGIDDDTDRYGPLPLTTVRLPLEPMAEAGWNSFAGDASATLGQSAWVRPELIVRESSPSIEHPMNL